jgi:hypothetical protein
MLDGRLEAALCLRADARDTIRQQLAAIVQKALEYADIAVIEIRDLAGLQRIRLLAKGIAALTAILIAATLIATTAGSRATTLAASGLRSTSKLLLCHLDPSIYTEARNKRSSLRPYPAM